MAVKFPGSLEHNNTAYPIAETNNIKGGYTVVTDITERNAIPEAKRDLGMLVLLTGTNIMYRYKGIDVTDTNWTSGSNWLKNEGAGVSVYNQDTFIISSGSYKNISNYGELETTGYSLDVVNDTIRATTVVTSYAEASFVGAPSAGIISANKPDSNSSRYILFNTNEGKTYFVYSPRSGADPTASAGYIEFTNAV